MTDINHIIRQVQRHLDDADIVSAAAEAPTIVAHVLQVERSKLGVMQALGETLAQDDIEQIMQLTEARATRIPLQHLTGVAGFYGLDIRVEPGVFIPRVETEVLVETTLQYLRDATGPLKILDLCTGTGAIAAALADQLSQRNVEASIWAIDLNPAAVRLAQHNTSKHQVTVLSADATDLDSTLAASRELANLLGTFDAVVSNPPYIPLDTPVTQHEARHDPHEALYGGSADGTQIPLAIAAHALRWLAPGGFFIMEHDRTHAADLATALRQHSGWQDVTTVQDLTQTNRCVTAIRTG